MTNKVINGTLGNASGGYHFEGIAEASGKVVEVTKEADVHGVYEAMVKIGGKAKKWPNTFFPKDWSAEQVLEAIEEGYSKIDFSVVNSNSRYDVFIECGIQIRYYLDATTQKIVSVFPIMQGGT